MGKVEATAAALKKTAAMRTTSDRVKAPARVEPTATMRAITESVK